jgi:hypothetical protein
LFALASFIGFNQRFANQFTSQGRDKLKLESTVRYLGIEVDDALEMAEQTEV